MITCPKCKSPDNIIAERPSWLNTDLDGEYIEIQSYCIDCKLNFTSMHKISRMLKIYDIENDTDYPY